MKKSKKLTLLLAASFLLLSCGLPLSTPTEDQPAAPSGEQLSETPYATFSMPTTTITATLTPTLEVAIDSTEEITSGIVWFYNQVDRSILRIDPAVHAIVSRVSMGGVPQQITTGEGSIWVIEAIDEQHSNILKIDATINQVIASIPITVGKALCLTTGGGSVWVGIARPYNPDNAPEGEEYIQPGGIIRINPASNQVAEFIDTGAVVVDLFLEGETLYSLEQ